MKDYFVLNAAILLIALTFGASAQKVEWVKELQGHPGTSRSDKITSDHSGNVYVVGHFDESIDFDPSEDQHILSSVGATDIFIQKLSPTGELLWVNHIGGAGNDRIRDVLIDQSGDVLVIGHVFGEVDLDPGPEEVLVNSSKSAIFILKFTSSGELIWHYHTNGTGSTTAFDLTVDERGDIYCTGVHNGEMDFDFGPEEHIIEALGSGGDIFILKISREGSFQWARSFGSAFFDRGRSVLSDSTGVYLRIDYWSEFEISPGVRIPHFDSSGFDAAIIKFDLAGSFLWFKNHSTAVHDGISVQFADGGDVFITSDVTVRYSSQGDLLDTIEHPLGFLPVLDNNGLAIRAGSWLGRRDFDPGPDSIILSSSLNVGNQFDFDIYAMRFDEEYKPEWIVTVQSEEQLLYRDGSLQTPDVFYFISEHQRELTIASPHDTLIVPGDGSNAAFIVKIRTCSPSFTEINRNVCTSFQFGEQVLTQSGVYIDTLIGDAGCDSVVQLNLVVDQISLAVEEQDTQLLAIDVDANYQWLSCTDGFTPVADATNAEFRPSDSGDYAVEITKGACIDTSDCLNFMTTALFNQNTSQFNIYPNPTSNWIQIDSEVFTPINVKIYGFDGTLHYDDKILNRKLSIDFLEAGIYHLNIFTESNIQAFKLIKI